jgi:hypothetical protein
VDRTAQPNISAERFVNKGWDRVKDIIFVFVLLAIPGFAYLILAVVDPIYRGRETGDFFLITVGLIALTAGVIFIRIILRECWYGNEQS